MMASPNELHLERPPDHDRWGVEAIREQLVDVRFPREKAALARKVGRWRVAMPGRRFMRLGDLLEPLPERTYRSADEVVRAIDRLWPELGNPTGPWTVETEPTGAREG